MSVAELPAPVDVVTATARTPAPSGPPCPDQRVRVEGKFFRLAGHKWYLKGLTYGPFSPNNRGEFLPERPQLLADLEQMRRLGANAIRLYHLPPRWLLDEAGERGLRLFIDVPWQKHRCFFEDWSARVDAVGLVHAGARYLGGHPAVLAISVANEIPKDVVRFYGARRIEQFVDELVDVVKQEAPDCLATYTNYPSTEFLTPSRLDFYCINVYLEDVEVLGRYLDRLQHVAGPLPLILGEHGIDSIRHGQTVQARTLGRQVREIYRRGLSGSFAFSYTDDWFTGAHQVEDWAFGVTDRQRCPEPAAAELALAWSQAPAGSTVLEPAVKWPGEHLRHEALPRVSVVVCSYNGAETLEECLRSLVALRYPDYEVILVDDGSTDQTPRIASGFPSVRYLRQENLGLSAARNAGALAATGRIVAYTDSDCVADELWLSYLVQAMQDQKADAIGGPNIPPPSDNWVARCVAASPGGPSHVMLDDSRAEHVPGCNMAFRRDKLLELGGFDVQFRQAGDDVDICWRLLAMGMKIGYAAAAVVWHHRRHTVGAYCRQQQGYGRAEAMLYFKHPHRFNALGCSQWHGVIYGEGAIGLPLSPPAVYHGRFGTGLFQAIYRRTAYSVWAYFTLLEWHITAVALAAMSLVWHELAVLPLVMWCATLATIVRAARAARLAPGAPWWCRPVVAVLHLVQPLVRAGSRYAYRLRHQRLPAVGGPDRRIDACVKRISLHEHDLYWQSKDGRGREHLLEALVEEARQIHWPGEFEAEWASYDLRLLGDLWHDVRLCTATEELGECRRFTRVRCGLHLTRLAAAALAGGGVLAGVEAAAGRVWPTISALVLWIAVLLAAWRSRRRCRRAVSRLVWRAGLQAGLRPVRVVRPRLKPAPPPAAPVAAGAGS